MTREWAEAQGEPEAWRRYWQVHPDGTEPELVHFIGKDNIVFHGLIFPAILQALNAAQDHAAPEVAGRSCSRPTSRPTSSSTSRARSSRRAAAGPSGPRDALDAFPADLLRYALAAGLPETKDADFTWSDFQNRANGELADVVGNFANRALTFAARFTDNAVPEPSTLTAASTGRCSPPSSRPPPLSARPTSASGCARPSPRRSSSRASATSTSQETEPWKTRKTDERRRCATRSTSRSRSPRACRSCSSPSCPRRRPASARC